MKTRNTSRGIVAFSPAVALLLAIDAPHGTDHHPVGALDPTCACAANPTDDGYYEDGVWLTLTAYGSNAVGNIVITMTAEDGTCSTSCEAQSGCSATLRFTAIGPFQTPGNKLCLPFHADESAYDCTNEQDANTGLWQCCVQRGQDSYVNSWEWRRVVTVGCGNGGSWSEVITAPFTPGVPASQPVVAECRWGLDCAGCVLVQPPG
ncbi:MAG: hypothetical protein AB7I19_11085 [Planctomycetota bacterium]